MSLNYIHLTDIVITHHALQRAKERLLIDADINSLEFEVKFKELVQKAEFRENDYNKSRYELVHQNVTYNIIGIHRGNQFIVNTVVCKDKSNGK